MKYVVITPARNEARFLEQTIASVVAQTVRPEKWIIVSDGSTDATDELVAKHAAQHPWIQLLRMPVRRDRHFAGKVHAFNAGLAAVGDIDYDVIASLDADISLDPEHFAFLLEKLAGDDSLGLVGTVQGWFICDYRFVSLDTYRACQVFRRLLRGHWRIRGRQVRQYRPHRP
jgi:glycosyltransferase involved in cell wall biosynthesis